MKFIFLSLSFFASGIAFGEQRPLDLDRIFASPSIEGEVLRGLRFSKDGSRLTFLKAKKENLEILDLWEFDLASGRSQLLVDAKTIFSKDIEMSEEEKARRERLRITSQGITEYEWSETGGQIVFPANNDLFLKPLDGIAQKITATPTAAEVDVQFSPKDNFISYVRKSNLYIYDLKNKKEYAVTTKGNANISYGLAEFIAQEEMGRFTGYWWSKDEKWLAFAEVDEAPVKIVERYEITANTVVSRQQRYPEAGAANAKVRLAVIKVNDVLNGKTEALQWLPILARDYYVPRVSWSYQGQLSYQVQSRDQKTVEMFLYNPETQKQEVFLKTKDKYWVDIKEHYWFKQTPRLLWTSNENGFSHLYLYNSKGQKTHTLTEGHWDVRRLVHVDEDGGWVYFMAALESPLQQHLYRVSLLSQGKPEKITQEEGSHFISMSFKGGYYVDYFSTPQQPLRVSLYKVDKGLVSRLIDNTVNSTHPLAPYQEQMPDVEFGSFPHKGFDLYYRLIKPKNFDANKKYPLVVMGYGGPGSQVVTQSWGGRQGLVAMLLAQRGFLVASIDNRGSPHRGKKFATQNYHAFGTVEVEDQTAGVKYFIQKGYVDAKNVGFFGWSYGGYLSLMLAMKSADVFKANVAVAPVTDFSLYDTHYTERFMGKPQENKKTYSRANVLNFTDQLKGKVLIMHGMADDNVLFTNSTLLFQKLQQSGKVYESVTYPGAKHGMSGMANQKHVYATMVDFFERHLK